MMTPVALITRLQRRAPQSPQPRRGTALDDASATSDGRVRRRRDAPRIALGLAPAARPRRVAEPNFASSARMAGTLAELFDRGNPSHEMCMSPRAPARLAFAQ